MTPGEAGTPPGPFALDSPLGAGGMGEVWKARDFSGGWRKEIINARLPR